MTDDTPKHATWADVGMAFMIILAVSWPFVLGSATIVLVAFATGK